MAYVTGAGGRRGEKLRRGRLGTGEIGRTGDIIGPERRDGPVDIEGAVECEGREETERIEEED